VLWPWLAALCILCLPNTRMNAAGASSFAIHNFPSCESDEQQARAVRGLLDRLLGPTYAGLFQLVLQRKPAGSHGFFSVEVLEDGLIVIEGSSGTLLASGVHWFLKYYASSRCACAACCNLCMQGSMLFENPLNTHQLITICVLVRS